MKYFKVKIGYGIDDYVSIDETELKKTMQAQVTGQAVFLKEGSISGKTIMSILPDFNREMGYNRDYKLTGEDYEHIGDKRVKESRDLLENTKNNILGTPAFNSLQSGI